VVDSGGFSAAARRLNMSATMPTAPPAHCIRRRWGR
jgi:hypothetical protein